jgi:GAF domain-containing protein
VLVSDPSALDWARGRQSIVAGGLRALVAVPILQQDRLLGAVYADSNAPGKVFTELDHEILAAFVEQAGLILAARGLDELLARIESCVESDSAGMPVERMAAPHWDRLP